eukprot:CAMPEP_0171528288 /NCGR_PEP_ID=MMETSP0959-20130129/11569_1 /TAXON_ID=87120 /ORGANISM="Aurantiochytrium limacinum, Strain ATCCMYA-1381" /LENGTH=104 /DNA_ID=CAMNT_0012070213 /DNA_START=960 /DNA_END=1274 /DNA_ORIENTATION=+
MAIVSSGAVNFAATVVVISRGAALAVRVPIMIASTIRGPIHDHGLGPFRVNNRESGPHDHHDSLSKMNLVDILPRGLYRANHHRPQSTKKQSSYSGLQQHKDHR